MVFATELGIKVVWDDSRVEAGIRHTQSDIRGFVSNVKSSISQGIGMALGQIGFGSIVEGVKRFVGGMISANAQWEDFNTQFGVMLGSAEKAKTLLNDIQNYAIKTPFQTRDLADATKTLLAFGTAQEEVLPTMKVLGDISLGNKQKFDSLTLAYGQSTSAGRLMGQDLLQMINAGFNPLQVISEKTGLSMFELKKKMEQGAISADMVKAAFRSVTEEGGRFYKGMDKGSQTFNGLMSTLKDTATILLREIGAPFFKKAKEGLVKVIHYVSTDEGKAAIKNFILMAGKAALLAVSITGVAKAFSLFKGVAGFISTVGEALIGMAANSGALIGMGRGATMAAGAMSGLTGVLEAITGPIGWVIAAITALVVAYKENFAGFRDWVQGMVADAQNFVAEIIAYFQDFAAENQDVIDVIMAYWEQLKKWWAVLFGTIMDIVKLAWELIKNIIRIALNVITGIVRFWVKIFHGDWAGAWDAVKDTLQKVWASFVIIVWNALLAILKIVKKFGDYFAKMFGMSFTGLDNSIKFAEETIKDYEAQVKTSHSSIRKEIKKTADEQVKANKTATDGFDWTFGDPTGGKGKGKKEGKTQEEKDAEKDAKDMASWLQEQRNALNDLYREQLRLNGAKDYEILQWEYERGLYPLMTADQLRLRKEAMQYNATLRDRNQTQDEMRQKQEQFNQSVAQYLQQAKQELAYSGAQTETEKILWEMREGKYKQASVWQRIFLVASAQALDADRKAKAGMEAYKSALKDVDAQLAAFSLGAKEAAVSQMMLNNMTREQAEEIWGKQTTLKGMTSYTDKMKDINDQLREMAVGTREAAIQQLMLDEAMTRAQAEEVVDKTRKIANTKSYKDALKELNKEMLELTSTAKEWQIQQLMADQELTRVQAEEIVKRKQQIEALKEYREQLKKTANDVTDIFMDALGAIKGGFGSFYKSVLDGFRRMLVEMAMAYIRSQVYKFIFNFFGQFGSKKSPADYMQWGGGAQYMASGGHMNARGPYVVGENGPELIVPDSSGHVYNQDQIESMVRSSSRGGTVINLGGITINGAKDFDSFKRNQGQLAADLHRMLLQQARKNR